MGAREDFDQALQRGDFAAAAQVWSAADLERDQAVQDFEAQVSASLDNRQYIFGETLTMAAGEYSYLGDGGNNGARLAYLPTNGSLDNVTYLRDQNEILAHLVDSNASKSDIDAVVAFFAVSEYRSNDITQQLEPVQIGGEDGKPKPVVMPIAAASDLLPEEALRAALMQLGDPPELIETAVAIAKQDFQSNRVYIGTLHAFGKAPYNNQPKNADSYFVSLMGPGQREEVVWGKELESALVNSGLNNGAAIDIVLSHQGMVPVTVRVPEVDSAGVKTGKMVDAPARRNQWKALSISQLREMAVGQQSLSAEAQHAVPESPVTPAAEMAAPVEDFKKRLQNATWFFDGIEDEAQKVSGQQTLGQLREDFKALMLEHPNEAAEVWRAVAPAEFQPELSDLLAQLESVAPDVIKAHQAHDLAAANHDHAPDDLSAVDSIQAAPAAGITETNGKDEDAIYQVVAGQGSAKDKPDQVDAISRVSSATADSIARFEPGSAARNDAHEAKQDVAGTALKSLLNGRFVLREHGQYYRVADGVESPRVALVDEANKIRFVDKQMDTFQAAIELAKNKQWEAILVTGSEKFRAEAWHHARMAGLEVVGYEPNDKDLATLKSARGGQSNVDIAKAATPLAPVLDGASNSASLKAAKEFGIGKGYGVSEAKTENGRHVGKIIHETASHIVQDVGKKVAVVHDIAKFDNQSLRDAIASKKPLKIQYVNGRAEIEGTKDRAQQRGR